MRMIRERKKSKKRALFIFPGVTIAALLLLVTGAGLLFREELGIIGTIRRLEEDEPVYYMEIKGDYHFDEFLEAGGASSDEEVSRFLTNIMSKGFYSVDVRQEGPACSVVSALDESGNHVWGRNFDWTQCVPVIVRNEPGEGYASISTCSLGNITGDPQAVPEDPVTRLLTIAALYVPMDGVNEAGLCTADLEVNEGGMIEVDTEKPDLTTTTAMRLILNRAATVEEAVALLSQYDIHASGGISHHIQISDAAGTSVVVEFVNGEMAVVPACLATNFNLAAGDSSAGGAGSQKRYEKLCSAYEENGGVMSLDEIWNVLRSVSQETGEWTTQWSMAYDGETKEVGYRFFGDDREHRFPVKE